MAIIKGKVRLRIKVPLKVHLPKRQSFNLEAVASVWYHGTSSDRLQKTLSFMPQDKPTFLASNEYYAAEIPKIQPSIKDLPGIGIDRSFKQAKTKVYKFSVDKDAKVFSVTQPSVDDINFLSKTFGHTKEAVAKNLASSVYTRIEPYAKGIKDLGYDAFHFKEHILHEVTTNPYDELAPIESNTLAVLNLNILKPLDSLKTMVKPSFIDTTSIVRYILNKNKLESSQNVARHIDNTIDPDKKTSIASVILDMAVSYQIKNVDINLINSFTTVKRADLIGKIKQYNPGNSINISKAASRLINRSPDLTSDSYLKPIIHSHIEDLLYDVNFYGVITNHEKFNDTDKKLFSSKLSNLGIDSRTIITDSLLTILSKNFNLSKKAIASNESIKTLLQTIVEN